jgi:hypothetical protein
LLRAIGKAVKAAFPFAYFVLTVTTLVRSSRLTQFDAVRAAADAAGCLSLVVKKLKQTGLFRGSGGVTCPAARIRAGQ